MVAILAMLLGSYLARGSSNSLVKSSLNTPKSLIDDAALDASAASVAETVATDVEHSD